MTAEYPADANPVSFSGAPASACAKESAGLPIYTFDCRRSDGSPVCLEAYELRSDARALAWARKLLAEHRTSSHIEVFEGERRVGTVAREPTAGDGVPEPGA